MINNIYTKFSKLSKVVLAFAMFFSLLYVGHSTYIYADTDIIIIEAKNLGGRTLDSGTYRITGNTDYTADDGENALKIKELAEVTLIIEGNVTLRGGKGVSWDTPGAAAIHLPEESSLNIRGSGKLKVYGGAAANGTNGDSGEGADLEDWNSGHTPVGGAGGAGGAGAGAGIGGNGALGGAESVHGKNVTESCGAIMIFDTVQVEAYGGTGGTGGAGGTGGRAYSANFVFFSVALAGGGGGGGGGGGFPAAGIGSGGAGGGGGGRGGSGAKFQFYFINPVGGIAWAGTGGGGGAGYGGGTGGSSGRSAWYITLVPAYDSTTAKSNPGGAPGDVGNSGQGNLDINLDFLGKIWMTPGTGGTHEVGGQPGACSHDAKVGVKGRESGKNTAGAYGLYVSDKAKLTAKHGGASGKTSMNAVDMGSGGGQGTTQVTTVSKIYNMNDATIEISPKSLTYDGNAHKPNVVVKMGTEIVSPSTYRVEYDDDLVSVGTKVVKVIGRADKSLSSYIYGEKTATYEVTKAKMNPVLNSSAPSIELGQTINIFLNDNKSDGKVTWHVGENSVPIDIVRLGDSSATVTPKETGTIEIYGEVEGNDTYEPATTNVLKVSVTKQGISNFVISGIEQKEYTGNEIFQENLKVSYNDATLIKDTDYTVKYDNNTAVGTAFITIEGIGERTGTIYSSFQIAPANINKATITKPQDLTYNGNAQTSLPTVYFNGEELVEGEDYQLFYNEYVNAGEVEVSVIGINDFTDTAKTSYTIKPMQISDANAQVLATGNYTYDGTQQKASAAVYQGDKLLNSSNDYTLSYENNVNAGTAKVIATGKGNYTGSVESTFTIDKAMLSIVGKEGQYKYRGGNDPKFEFTYSGNIDSDTPTFNPDTGIIREAGEDLGVYRYDLGDLELDASNPVNNNYSLSMNEFKTFEIKAYIIPDEATLEGTKGNNDWYISRVKIKAPKNYLISTTNSATGNWSEYVTYDDGDFSENGAYYYLKEIRTGYISEYKTIKYKQDTEGAVSRVIVNKSKAWTGMYPTPSFDKTFFNEDANIGIYGDDDLSGIEKVEYYVDSNILNENDLKKVDSSKWITISNDVEAVQKDTKKHIVYVKMEDKAGNISYGRSDGFIIDRVKPVINYKFNEEGDWTSNNDIEIKTNITDDTAGLKDRYVDYDIDGKNKQLIALDDSGNGVISSLPDGDYTLTINATDNAENKQSQAIHVLKDTYVPTISATGDTESYATEQKVSLDIKTGASGIDKVYVQFVASGDEYDEKGDWQDITAEYNSTGGYVAKKNGNYYFKVVSVVGLESDNSRIGFSRIDSSKPVINYIMKTEDTKTYDNDSWTNQSVQISFTNTTANLGTTIYEYSTDDETWNQLELVDGYANVLLENSEVSNIRLRLTSNAGVESEITNLTIKIDKVNPYGNVSVEENNWRYVLKKLTCDLFYNKTTDLNVSPVDDLSGVEKVEYFIVSGDKTILEGAPQTVNEVERLATSNGGWNKGDYYTFEPNNKYNIGYAKVTDKAGNKCYLSTDGFLLDNVQPDITFTGNGIYDYGDAGKWFTSNDDSLTVTINDELSGIDFNKTTYQIESNEIQKVTLENNTFVISDLADGEYRIAVEAYDIAGNKARSIYGVKKDTVLPEAKIIADTENYMVTADSLITLSTGISGLKKVERQFVEDGAKLDKNNWEDITNTYTDNYQIRKNGKYYVRVTDNLDRETTTSAVFDKIEYIESKANVWIEDADGNHLKNTDWLNSKGHIAFSNDPANVKGFTYEYREKGTNDWSTAEVDGNGIARFKAAEGEHIYEVKVSNGTDESIKEITVKADNTLPSATLIFGDIDDNGEEIDIKEVISENTDVEKGNSIQKFFPDLTDKKIALKEVSDKEDGSGVDTIEYFVDFSQGDYLKEFPETDEEIEKYIETIAGGWDSKIAYTRWIKLIDSNQCGVLTTSMRQNRSYVVYVKVTDKAGNARYITTKGFAFDNRIPEIETDYENEKWLNQQSEGVKVSLINSIGGMGNASYIINGIEFDVDASNIKDESFIIPLDKFINGENEVTIQAENRLGINAEEKTLTILVEKDKGIISVDGNTNRYSLEETITLNISGFASGIDKVEVLKDDEKWLDITDTYTEGYLAEENGTYKFRVTSKAGNISENAEITFDKIDSDPPVPVIETFEKDEENVLDSYTPETWTVNDVEITIANAHDNYGTSVVEYQIDSGNARSRSNAWQTLGELADTNERQTLLLKDTGEHPVNFRIKTELGRISEPAQVEVLIDKEAPELEAEIVDGNWKNDKALVKVKAKDSLSGIKGAAYSYDGGLTFTTSNTVEIKQNQAVNVLVKDVAGNIKEGSINVNNIDKLAPKIESFSLSSQDWAKNKNVIATIKDAEATKESGMSGIDYVFLTSHNPYSGKTITRTVPKDDDILMRSSNNSSDFITSQSITKFIDDIVEDNYYIVAVDEAGNASATSLCVNKIDGVKEETPSDKNDSYQDVIDQIEDFNQNNQSQSSNEQMSSDQKNTIADILDKIESLLNDKITDEEKEVLVEKKKELIIQLVDSLIQEEPKEQKTIKENLEYIERLLLRDDLTSEQRTQLEKKMKELQSQIEGEEKELSLFILSILGLILLLASFYYSYKRKKQFKRED